MLQRYKFCTSSVLYAQEGELWALCCQHCINSGREQLTRIPIFPVYPCAMIKLVYRDHYMQHLLKSQLFILHFQTVKDFGVRLVFLL